MTQQQVYNPELQQKLQDYCKKIGSQAKAAKIIGGSDAKLSQYLSGKYHTKGGDVAKYEEQLEEFFSTEEKAAGLYIAEGYVSTSISEDTYECIEICHMKGKLVDIVGDSGIGKTMGAKKYVADHPNSAFLITPNPCFSTVTAFFSLVCQELQIDAPRRQDAMWLAIEKRLQGGRKVIIVDEAQHLPVKVLDSLRAFCDKHSEIGVALIGNLEVITKRKTPEGMTKEPFRQINNRTRFTSNIHRTYDLKIEDVQLLFPNLPQKETEFMHVIIQSEQGIRGAINTIEIAVDHDDISYNGLCEAAKSAGVFRFGNLL